MVVVIVLAIVVLVVVLLKVRHSHKVPKIGSLALVTGGVKTGKTTFAVHLAIKNYNRAVMRWRITSVLSFLKKSWKGQEKPLLYSNIPLTVPYVPVTRSMLLRESRFNYKSVILLSEASLVADSQMIKNQEWNDKLLLWVKLIAHETRGGCVVLDTQSIGDLHYSFKRCLSEYFYIHHIFKWFPGYIIAWIQEQRYSDDGSVISAQTGDIEDQLKWILIPKKVWKVFDTYTYSAMTDDLPAVSRTRTGQRGHLKSTNIVSFRDRSIAKKKVENKCFSPVNTNMIPVPASFTGVIDQSDTAAPVNVVNKVSKNEKKDN